MSLPCPTCFLTASSPARRASIFWWKISFEVRQIKSTLSRNSWRVGEGMRFTMARRSQAGPILYT